jgi:hypothetical protein
MKGISSLVAAIAVIAAVSISVASTSYILSRGYLTGTTTTTMPSQIIQIIETTTIAPYVTTNPPETTTLPFIAGETTTIFNYTIETNQTVTTTESTTTFLVPTTILVNYEQGKEKCCNDIDDDNDGLENGYDPDCQVDVDLTAGLNIICWRTEWYPYGNGRDYYSGWFKCPDGYIASQANMTWSLAEGDCFYVYGKDNAKRVEICGSKDPSVPPSNGMQWVKFRFVSDVNDTRIGVEVQSIECSSLGATSTTTSSTTTIPGDTTTSVSSTTTTSTTTITTTSTTTVPGDTTSSSSTSTTTSTTTSSSTTYSTSSTTTSTSTSSTTTVYGACRGDGDACGVGHPCCSGLYCSYGYCTLNPVACPILRVWNGKDFVDVEKLNIHAPEDKDTIATSIFSMKPINGKYEIILHEAAYQFWDGSHIDYVKLTDETGKECKLISAKHSTYGNVLSKLIKVDGIRVRTYPEQEIKLVYTGCSGDKFTFTIVGYNRKCGPEGCGVLGFEFVNDIIMYALIVVIILGIAFSIIQIFVNKSRLLKT